MTLPSRNPLVRSALRALPAHTLAPLVIAGLTAGVVAPATAADSPPASGVLTPCRLKGVEHEARCGVLRRPLDPAAPNGTAIDLHFAVLPALARNKRPDPVFFFAGGPGQSAIELAGTIGASLSRFLNRRDVVLIDQRGTGTSAPLTCPEDPPGTPMAEVVDPARQAQRLKDCLATLRGLPHGDLRHYTTTIAMADADAVRAALGAEQINLIGGSYGTRAALEYQRQFPQHVRRTVIDGVAPPDMVLPVSFSTDAQAAFDALLGWCTADAACKKQFPALRADWARMLAGLPRDVTMADPLTGRPLTMRLDRDTVLSLIRLPLYVPAFTSALPRAVSDAADGRFEALVGLTTAMTAGPGTRLAMGMHLSVVCAEDAPRIDSATDRPGADFGGGFTDLYRRMCADWPRGAVPADFYRMPPAKSAVLVLSGSIDPVTPPRHGARTAQALGPLARHVVVPNAGHGTMTLPCLRDAVFRFVDAATDDEALKVDTGCAAGLPRPPLYIAPGATP